MKGKKYITHNLIIKKNTAGTGKYLKTEYNLRFSKRYLHLSGKCPFVSVSPCLYQEEMGDSKTLETLTKEKAWP